MLNAPSTARQFKNMEQLVANKMASFRTCMWLAEGSRLLSKVKLRRPEQTRMFETSPLPPEGLVLDLKVLEVSYG